MAFEPGYREHRPPPALGGAIACWWTRVAPSGKADPVDVLPDACVDIVWRAGEGAVVAGPDTAGRHVRAPAGSVIAGVRFLPGAGGTALGLPLSELCDLTVPLDELDGKLARGLQAELDPAQAVRRLTAGAARLVAVSPPDPAVRAAVRALDRPGSGVATLADQLGLSERQLRRRCRAAVGYGPKALDRVLRFRRFLALVDTRAGGGDLARTAFEAGYADQPHLTRECVRLSGRTPLALVASRA